MLALSGLVAIVGCGGGGTPGDPLISGSLTGEYEGQPFTPTFGFATLYEGTTIIGLGDGDLNCASPAQNEPPPGTNAILALPSFDVGAYSNVFVNLYHNVDGFEGAGSNGGSVTITASSADSVAGTISYAYTDDAGMTFGLDGTFDVVRCPI